MLFVRITAKVRYQFRSNSMTILWNCIVRKCGIKSAKSSRTVDQLNFVSAMILRPAGGHDRALRKRADRSGKWTNRVPSLPPWRNQGSPFAPFPSAYFYHPVVSQFPPRHPHLVSPRLSLTSHPPTTLPLSFPLKNLALRSHIGRLRLFFYACETILPLTVSLSSSVLLYLSI